MRQKIEIRNNHEKKNHAIDIDRKNYRKHELLQSVSFDIQRVNFAFKNV